MFFAVSVLKKDIDPVINIPYDRRDVIRTRDLRSAAAGPKRPERSRKGKCCCWINAFGVERVTDFKDFMGM